MSDEEGYCRECHDWFPPGHLARHRKDKGREPVEHYKARGGIEPVDFIVTNNMSFLEGNVIKYLYRYPHKGTAVADLAKAINCLKLILDGLEGDE